MQERYRGKRVSGYIHDLESEVADPDDYDLTYNQYSMIDLGDDRIKLSRRVMRRKRTTLLEFCKEFIRQFAIPLKLALVCSGLSWLVYRLLSRFLLM